MIRQNEDDYIRYTMVDTFEIAYIPDGTTMIKIKKFSGGSRVRGSDGAAYLAASPRRRRGLINIRLKTMSRLYKVTSQQKLW